MARTCQRFDRIKNNEYALIQSWDKLQSLKTIDLG